MRLRRLFQRRWLKALASLLCLGAQAGESLRLNHHAHEPYPPAGRPGDSGAPTGLAVSPAPGGCAEIPGGLVSWWSGDQTAADRRGRNHGQAQGDGGFASGWIGSSFRVGLTESLSEAFVEVADDPSLRAGTMTIMAWIWRSPMTGYADPIVIKGGGANQEQRFGFALEFAGDIETQLNFFVYTQGGWIHSGRAPVAFETWTHVAGVYDGQQVGLYVDGESAGFVGAPGPLLPSTEPLQIGHNPVNPGRRFYGLIDEVLYFDRALTAEDIHSVYAAGNRGVCGPNEPPVVALINPQNGQHFPSPAEIQVEATATDTDGTIAGVELRANDVTLAQLTKAPYQCTWTNPPAGSHTLVAIATDDRRLSTTSTPVSISIAPTCVPPPCGIVAWWAGETTAQDAITGNEGTLLGPVAFDTGIVGHGFNFRGGVIDVPNAASLEVTNLTIETWVRLDESGYDNQVVFGKGANRLNLTGAFWLIVRGSAPLSIGPEGKIWGEDGARKVGLMLADGVREHFFLSQATLQFGVPVHFAACADGRRVTLYVNGELDAQYPQEVLPGKVPDPLQVGGIRSEGGQFAFLGLLDELALYDRALTPAEVRAISTSGASGKCREGPAPITIEVLDASASEGVAAGQLQIRVRLSEAPCRPVRVHYHTSDLTAAAAPLGSDYTPTSGWMEFTPGQREQDILVPILNDPLREPAAETFKITLSEPLNATLLRPEAVGTILDDDQAAPPQFADLGEQMVLEDGQGRADFWIADADTSPDQIRLTASSGNAELIPNANLSLQGSDTNRSLAFRPESQRSGEAWLTLTAHDGEHTVEQRFKVTVVPVNDAPSFTSGPDLVVKGGVGPQRVSEWATRITPGPPDEAEQALAFEVIHDNPGLFRDPPFLSPDGTLTFTPAAHAHGLARIQVTLTDNGGSDQGGVNTSPPATFTITVETVNAPPTVALIAPTAGQMFLLDTAVQATAVATDPDGEVASVELIVDGGTSAGIRATPPYEWTLHGLSVGEHLLTATAMDKVGAVSAVPASVRIAVVTGEKDVAVITRASATDTQPLTGAIEEVSRPGEQSLSWRLFPRVGLEARLLARHRLVIWFAPEPQPEVAPEELAVLQQLLAGGIPLILLGPRVGSAAAHLPVPLQAAWNTVTHVVVDGGTVAGGTFVPQHTEWTGNILRGGFGDVGEFEVQLTLDRAAVLPDADSFAQVEGSDVVVSHPLHDPDDAPVRSYSMLLPLVQGGDAESALARKRLLQNIICRALNCSVCPAAYPTLEWSVEPQPPGTSSPATLHLDLSNGGECDGVKYRATLTLSEKLRFLSATASAGVIEAEGRNVTLRIGRFTAREHVLLNVEVLPVEPGWITNQVSAEFEAGHSTSREVPFEVYGDRIPVLRIVRTSLDTVRLEVEGESGRGYAIERAVLGMDRLPYSWTAITQFVLVNTVFRLEEPIRTADRGALYRVRKIP